MNTNEQQSKAIIDELLQAGSDPNAWYIIEHHISSNNFDKLEKLAMDVYKKGFEATDPEEFSDDRNNLIFTFDAVCESKLELTEISQQQQKLFELIKKYQAQYDGWGTYFEDPNQIDDDDKVHFDQHDDDDDD